MKSKNENLRIEFNIDNVEIDAYAEFIMDRYIESNKEEIIIVNVGTDRVQGDSFGPLVGSYLEENNCSLPYYGTLEKPLTAINLDSKWEEIKEKHKDAFVIAIDAQAGILERVGNLLISNSSIRPGSAANKKLPVIGDISIESVTCAISSNITISMHHVRLFHVYKAAKITCEIIKKLEALYYRRYASLEVARHEL